MYVFICGHQVHQTGHQPGCLSMILHVVSCTGTMTFPLSYIAPGYFVSRNGSVVRPAPVSPLIPHAQAYYIIINLIWCLLAGPSPSSRFSRLPQLPYIVNINRLRVSHEFIGSRNCVPMAFPAESSPAQSL